MKNVQTQLQNQKGFTLVEIAIVLVIIGLLLGGVLKGQELIQNSKIKSVTQDLEGVTAGYYAYKDRTGEYPGAVDNGADVTADTAINFWQDLRTEGFVAGASSDASGPTHALDGALTVDNFNGDSGTAKNWVCAANITQTIAEGMDNNYDDGVLTTGKYRYGTAGGAADDTTLCKEM